MGMHSRRENAVTDSRDLHGNAPNCMESGYELDTRSDREGREIATLSRATPPTHLPASKLTLSKERPKL